MSTASQCRIALVQQAPVYLNLAATVERACEHIQQASDANCDVIVFPETWLPGYPIWLDTAPTAALWDHPPAKQLFRQMVEQSPSVNDAAIVALRSAAVEAGVFVVIGVQEREGGTLYNSMLFIDPAKGEYRVHRKLMPTYTERLVWGRGDGSTLDVNKTPFGNLGGLICWEHWMPLARAALHARGEAIHVAQWPWAKEMHQVASRHYAFEGSCFVIASGAVVARQQLLDDARDAATPGPALELLAQMTADDDDLLLRGGSAVVAPNGDYVVAPVYDNDATLYADLDLGLIAEHRLALDTDGHYSRPDVFSLEVDTRPQRNVTFR
ncbi:MAG: carbon-nitrogen hydrolase family protein [Gammaproteobacteria bacterium]|nr:carbon-nitrogen hydrolase family protein [Gammaproteobacteria bacterium]